MEDKKTRTSVVIYGEEYNIKGDMTVEHIENLARYVDRKMKQIGGSEPRLSMNKVAVLASLNIAEELFKLQREYNRIMTILERKENKGKRNDE